MRLPTAAVLALALSGCAHVADLGVAPASTAGQRVYRAFGVVEASANWTAVYVVQPGADPIASASLVDAVMVADDGARRARSAYAGGGSVDPALAVVGQAVTGLVLVAEAKQSCGLPPSVTPAGIAETLIEDASARMMRLGAARGRLEGLRQRLAAMGDRDPTPKELDDQAAATADAVTRMLAAAKVRQP